MYVRVQVCSGRCARAVTLHSRARARNDDTRIFFYYDLMTRVDHMSYHGRPHPYDSALTPSRKWMAIIEREAWGGAVMVANIVYVHVTI